MKAVTLWLQHEIIALDSSIFIHALNNSAQFPEIKLLFEGFAHYKGKLITSTVSLLELSVPAYRAKNRQVLAGIINFLYGESRVMVCSVDRIVALRSAELRANYRLKTPDAIQLATALQQKAGLFLTTDADFKMPFVEGMKVVVISPLTSN